MKNPKLILLAVALVCFALEGAALYMQFVENMLPCPLCIIQRYAFAVIALISVVAAFLRPRALRIGAALAVLPALAGAGVAGWHIYIQAHPSLSCGIDPLETSLNTIPTARLLPFLFQADGLCTTPYPPLFGLSLPEWGLIWFVILALSLIFAVLQKKR